MGSCPACGSSGLVASAAGCLYPEVCLLHNAGTQE